MVQGALEEVGLRSALCYEVTDRNGAEGRDLGIEENVTFAKERTSALTRGLVGAHASFTLGDDSLARLAQAVAETGSSLHVHVAEDRADVDDSRSRHGCTLVERFDRHGLLASRALLAHCVHLTGDEVQDVHAKGCWIAHNPRSNMNNAVGYAPTAALRRAALGTDGMDEDMLAEARAAYLRMREAGRETPSPPRYSVAGAPAGRGLFGLPFGSSTAEPADLVVLDYRPPTELHQEQPAGHLLFGIDRSHAFGDGGGPVDRRDRRMGGVDAAAIFARARDAARDVRSRWPRSSVGGTIRSCLPAATVRPALRSTADLRRLAQARPRTAGASQRYGLGVETQIVQCGGCSWSFRPFRFPLDPARLYADPDKYFAAHGEAAVQAYRA